MKPVQEMPVGPAPFPENAAQCVDPSHREQWQFNVHYGPTPVELAMIAAPLRANAQSPYDDNLEAIKDAYALWQEARAFIEAQKERA